MEIAISKKGGLRVLTVKGNLRLQHWRVIGKHLEALLGQGARWVALDLPDAASISETGLACLHDAARAYRERDANLMALIANPAAREAARASRSFPGLGDCLFADWGELEGRLQAQSAAIAEA
jgi:anti-anti-sigma regulatory factor